MWVPTSSPHPHPQSSSWLCTGSPEVPDVALLILFVYNQAAKDQLIWERERVGGYWPPSSGWSVPLQYEAIITEGNEALVHHMEVFQCTSEFETNPNFSGPCDSKMKPERLNYCRHVLAAWALGAKVCAYCYMHVLVCFLLLW